MTYEEIAIAAFGREAMEEIYRIYDARTGGIGTVDRVAVERILDRFLAATDREKDAVKNWAAISTR